MRSVRESRARVAAVLLLAAAPALAADGAWKPLFDGVSLQGWIETPFSGHGTVAVADGAIVLGAGSLTGVNRAEFPKSNYEVRL